ncbi:MAG: hypothetical protein J0I12_16835 [Candidatus Eremiobacteraeota bacterium]|nr:hypothetical protein [Candidatus Eremiobacteraeota bacterium]
MKWIPAIAVLAVLSSPASFADSLLSDTVSVSPNGRYKFVFSPGGGQQTFWDGPTELWMRPTNWVMSEAAVSDQGDLVMCRCGRDWIVYGKGFQELAHPAETPIRFDLDPPRTCWTRQGALYTELSQGSVYQIKRGRWSLCPEASSLPPSIREHQRARISDLQIAAFLKGESFPNFTNLTTRQVVNLQKEVEQGNARAGLALVLGGRRQARKQLLHIAEFGRYPHEWNARKAILLLDGPAAAKELAPSLKSEPGGAEAELFCRVSCPEVIPKIVEMVGPERYEARRILVFQTGVDLGFDSAAWKRWFAQKDPQILENFLEPSIALRKAQRRDKSWVQSLLKRPRLLAIFPSGTGSSEKVLLQSDRLLRVAGGTLQRGLEWDLHDGRQLRQLPDTIPPAAWSGFAWHPVLDYLWSQAGGEESLWQGPNLIFRSNRSRSEGTRPAWLPKGFRPSSFEGDELEGSEVSTDVRYRISDGARTLVRYQAQEAISPDGRYTVDRFMPLHLVDHQTGGETTREDLRELAVCFSPDGRFIAAGMFDEVTLLDATNLKTLRTFLTPGWFCRKLSFDPTGRHMLVESHTATCWYDLEPEPPISLANPLQVAEAWTGFRLEKGAPRCLTPEEYWKRR